MNPAHSPPRLVTLSFVLAGLLILMFIAASAAAGPWAGREVVQDGVKHVLNPAEAMEPPVAVELEERWRLGDDPEADDEFFGVVGKVLEAESGDVYVLDTMLNEVKVFDAAGGFLRVIGREGEGPGEFRQARDMVFLPDGKIGVLQLVPGKIVQLALDGEPAGEHPLPVIEGAGFLIIVGAQSNGGDVHLVFGYNRFESGQFTTVRQVGRLAPDGTLAAVFASGERHIDFSKPVVEEKQWDGFENRWALGPDGRVFAAETWGEYAVTVWNPDGGVELVIEREHAPRRRSAEEKARLAAVYEPLIREVPNGSPGIEDHDHPITQVHARADGTLWVLSCRGAFDRPDGSLGTFDVFDREGRFLRQVTLLGEGDPFRDGYLFQHDKLFVLKGVLDAAVTQRGGASEEAGLDDAEPMQVICYRLELPGGAVSTASLFE